MRSGEFLLRQRAHDATLLSVRDDDVLGMAIESGNGGSVVIVIEDGRLRHTASHDVGKECKYGWVGWSWSGSSPFLQ